MLGLLVLFCFLACNFQLQQQLNPSLKNTLMFRSQRNQKKKKKKKKNFAGVVVIMSFCFISLPVTI